MLEENIIENENYQLKLIEGIKDAIDSGTVVVLDDNLKLTVDNIRELDPRIDQGVLVVDDQSRHDPRMIVVDGQVLFAKELSNEAIDIELLAHEACLKAGINHFTPVFYTKGENGYGYFATRREFVLPLSKLELDDLMSYKAFVEEACALLTLLHIAGIKHQDAKPKNMGYNDAGYWIYDFETAIIQDHPLKYAQHMDEIEKFLDYVTVSIDVKAKLDRRAGKEYWAQDPVKNMMVHNLKDEILNKHRSYPY